MKTIDLEKAKAQVPGDLLTRVEALEERFARGELGEVDTKIALFDMDNTLLVGDVGDAVFAQLLLEQRPLALTWAEYDSLIKSGRKREAYERVVTAMAGISLHDLLETTRNVLHCQEAYLEAGEMRVAIPRPKPVMKALLDLLESLAYRVYVISATNQPSVRLAMNELFGLEESHAFGLRPRLLYKEQEPGKGAVALLGDELEEPVTVAQGKAEVYKKYISTVPPLLSGGNSLGDIPMLNLTHRQGLVIWVGADTREFATVKQQIEHPESLYHLKQ